jgi:hypothetical protein
MKHSTEDGTARVIVAPQGTTVENPASEASVQTTPEQVQLATVDGHTATLTSSALTLEDPLGATVVINANGITFTKDGKTTTLSLLQLLHDDGVAKTMSITEDQVIGTDASGSVVMDSAEGVRHTVGGNETELTSDGITTTSGGDTAELTPEGGVTVSDGTNTASLNANRLQLTGGGTTTVGKIAGETVELRDTDFCEVVGGEPVTQQAPVLRGVPA